ncbi:TnsA endonuclease N-terminal domain-containing protein [Sulfitobacter sp.]|uniref:TnsA endonuclease N-terminal domain-containing protein n=1 Tax=Sulfitobacter sp. TaxID=1903071 RepID=UPI003EF5D761
MRVLYLLLARPDIWDLREQIQRLPYCNSEGQSKGAVYDFLVTLRCGRRVAIAVKPAAIVERSGFRQELELIRAATPLSLAHDVVLVTDRSFTPAEARNAERLHEFRRFPDADADKIILDLLRWLNTETTIAELVKPTGLGGRGFRAAFRLLCMGAAKTLEVGDISPQTRIVGGDVR